MFKDINEIRTMTHDERVLLGDKLNKSDKANHIVVKDAATGRVLFTRRNLVVRGGRELILRKLFNLPYTSETIDNLNSRFVSCFGIGSGGTPVSSPFQPISPTPADNDVNSKVAFKTDTTASPLTAEDKTKYFDPLVISGGTSYYKKAFSSISIVTDDVNDDYYVKLTLDINESDARGALLSEIGIYSAVLSGNTYSNFKMFSRITFDTESMNANTGKGLTIEYYVYA